MYSCWLIHFEDVFWRHVTKANILVLIKRSSRQRRKMSSRCLQNFFTKTNVCYVITDVLLKKNDSISTNVSSKPFFFWFSYFMVKCATFLFFTPHILLQIDVIYSHILTYPWEWTIMIRSKYVNVNYDKVPASILH